MIESVSQNSDGSDFDYSEAMQEFIQEIDQLTCYGITSILQQMDFPMNKGESYNIKQLIEEKQVDTRYYELIFQWFSLLHQLHIVATIDHITYTNKMDLSACQLPPLAHYPNILKFSTSCIENGQAILTGKISPASLLFSKDALSPMEVICEEPGAIESHRLVATIINRISTAKKKPIHILELGARSSSFTEAIIQQLAGVDYHYTITDASVYFKGKFDSILSDQIEFATLDMEIDPILQGYTCHKYDLIIANNALHRIKKFTRNDAFY